MPAELLSTGTHDSIALAFRFEMLDQLYNRKSGFVILDDCLIDLDPVRKQRAAELIKKFCQKESGCIYNMRP